MTLTSTDVAARDGATIRRWACGDRDATDAVFFVHGATYGGRAAFAPEGVSWLDAVADAGWAAYTLDARGYGDSERPLEMDMTAAANDPVVRATQAARDAADTLEAVRERHDRVHLVGYSWGTIIAGVLLTEEGADVDSLTQYAPVYHPPETHRERYDFSGAYRIVERAEARERWAAQLPDGDVPDGAFDAFWTALAESGQAESPNRIRAPNGTLADIAASVDDPRYDPGEIDVPTLVVRGSLDTASVRADALGLYDALGAERREYVELAGGTHFLQFEAGRERLYETVRGFQSSV